MSDDLAFTYDEKKNPDGVWVDGVPLRDLTKADYDKLPNHLRAAVRREPFYVAVGKPKTEAAKPSSKGDK